MMKKTLDELLNEVDYSYLNSTDYTPSEFALTFMNFVKLVNGKEGEANKTPPVHLAMLDKITGRKGYIANLCFRGLGKTTVFAEYLLAYLGVFNVLPGFGEISGVLYVADSMDNGAKGLRKNLEFRYNNSEFLQTWITKANFTDNFIEFTNKEGKQIGIKLFGAKTGLRGSKIYGKRPVLAILDDLVSDDDSKSKVAMEAIKDTVYKGVNHALDPTKRKVIFNGTPFNKEDILVEAVESGAWDVNVWPVCEQFPCEEKDFRGAWEDRFSYSFVKEQYDMSVATGKTSAFNQELMLRLSTAEDRLIQEGEIRWYDRKQLLEKKHNFNFYITSDFATTNKTTSDFTVISVWAYNANGDWFWVDGICARQLMDKTTDDLFRLVQTYKPQAVGIETSGQQNAIVTFLQREQMYRNIWFSFASNRLSNQPGISVTKDKLSRLNLVVPWFKAGKMYFPTEMKTSVIIGEFMSEISLATTTGIKGKDDCLDTISMLGELKPWKPNEGEPMIKKDSTWEIDSDDDREYSNLSSYIV